MSTPSVSHTRTLVPLGAALGGTLSVLGLLYLPLVFLGVAVLGFSIVRWIEEEVRELSSESVVEGKSDYRLAVIFLVLGEVVLFSALFFYWFWARAHSPSFPPVEIREPDLRFVLFNSLFLFASAWTAHASHKHLYEGRRREFQRYLSSTFLLGSLFLLGQGWEYAHAGSGPASGTFGSAFFALTGVHGLHVLVGLGVLLTLGFLARRGFLDEGKAEGYSGAVLYWHFVDAVWVFILLVVYLRWV